MAKAAKVSGNQSQDRLTEPKVFRTGAELAEELKQRLEDIEQGKMEFFDAAESLRRAKEALASRRG
jgi:hypothetical protein